MSVRAQIEPFLAAMTTRGYATSSCINYRSHLGRFATFLEAQDASDVEQLSRERIEDYVQHLASGEKPLSVATRNVRLSTLKSFCLWLVESDLLAIDPSEAVAHGRKPVRLPRTLPSVEVVKELLAAPDPRSLVGYRDRVVLELLYQSGLRVGELCALDVTDLDLANGFAHVQRGKGGRGRVVPIGKLAVELVTNYVVHVRPKLAARGERALIVARTGARLGSRGVERVIDRCAKRVGLEGQVTPHVLRHTCATHMLRGGANIRHLQEMLGHASLSSTQVYTQVTAGELKDVHARFHPRGSVEESGVRRAKTVRSGRSRKRGLG